MVKVVGKRGRWLFPVPVLVMMYVFVEVENDITLVPPSGVTELDTDSYFFTRLG